MNKIVIPALFRRIWRRHAALVISMILLCSALGLLWADGSRPYIDAGFSYTAQLVSTRNEHDAANDRYSGEQYSQTTYAMQLARLDASAATVRVTTNTTDVAKQPFPQLQREYRVTPSTGALQPDDKTYLFAPRNLQRGQSFDFQHITYHAPASMRYTGSEKLFGLELYHYKATYSSTTTLPADDTATAPLPQGQGLEYAPNLEMWVEPVTGWLVKYREDTTVYYYDQATRERLRPSYHFATAYTEASVRQQATYAADLKLRQSFARQIIPGMLIIGGLLLGIIIGLRLLKLRSIPTVLSMGAVLAVALATLIGWVLHIGPLMRLFGSSELSPWTMLCFAFLAIAVLLLYKRTFRVTALLLSGVVTAMAVLQLLGHMALIPFNPERLVFYDATGSSVLGASGHFSIIATFLLLILGIGLIKSLLGRSAKSPIAALHFARMACAIVVTISLICLTIRLLLLDQLIAMSFVHALPVSELVLFAVLGAGLFHVLQAQHGHPTDIKHVARGLLRYSVVAVPIVLLAVVAQLQQNTITQQLQSAFEDQTIAIEQALDSKTETYAHMLTGAKALFAASNSVEPDEWHAYITALNVPQFYPGVQVSGFVAETTAAEVRSPISFINQHGLNAGAIFPAGSRTVYAPVLYVEPLTGLNQRTIGYDMLTDNIRRSALEQARDTGQPTISGKLNLLQETDKNGRSGFLLLVPIYKNGKPIATKEERRQNLDGYAYSLIDAQVFLRTALRNEIRDLHVAIYDGQEAQSPAQFYESGSHTVPDTRMTPALTSVRTTYIGGHPWTLRYTARPSLRLSSFQERMPALLLTGGSVCYFLAVLLFYSVHTLRRRAVTAIQDTDQRAP